jgi:molybdopterin converting factor small subunit
MSITVELTYEMGKALGTGRLEEFERLTRVAAVSVNGVLASHRRGLRTPVADGDRVMFVKASAGG